MAHPSQKKLVAGGLFRPLDVSAETTTAFFARRRLEKPLLCRTQQIKIALDFGLKTEN